MAYYLKVLQPNENVKYIGKLHWIIYKNAILLVLLAVIVAGISMGVQAGAIALVAILTLLALAVGSFVKGWFRRFTTEIVVTDKRIIHKRGWISRRTEEMNITKVETVDVGQAIGGRIFGYGTILVRGIGGSWEPLSPVADPLDFRNAIIVG
jgi:uncharacterized membrane protein YdbT with pleckstrin-like domain